MKFIDEVRIWMQSGDGGRGIRSFRRERFVPRGGPDGGNGGNGGSIQVQGNPARQTLIDVRTRQRIQAPHGTPGRNQLRHGRDGHTITLDLPLGTIVRRLPPNSETTTPAAPSFSVPSHSHDAPPHAAPSQPARLRFTAPATLEILDEEPQLLLQGGSGGKGNARFKSATQRAPQYAQEGTPGHGAWFHLELKLLADVGLVGLPNAGKSTLIRRVSAARPRVAAYPFTTLTPQLGVVACTHLAEHGRDSYVIADLPGIVQGAHRGAGLGHRFLRHIERTSLLLLLIDAASPEHAPSETHRLLLDELAHNPALLAKPRCIVLNKIDLLPLASELLPAARTQLEERGERVFSISAQEGRGIAPLLRHLEAHVVAQPKHTSAGGSYNPTSRDPESARRRDLPEKRR